MPQIQDIIKKVNAYSLLNALALLPRHRALLKADFTTLGNGPASHRLLWLADMDSAISVAMLAQLGSLTPQGATFFTDDSPLPRRY
jgi:hypothetical protein